MDGASGVSSSSSSASTSGSTSSNGAGTTSNASDTSNNASSPSTATSVSANGQTGGASDAGSPASVGAIGGAGSNLASEPSGSDTLSNTPSQLSTLAQQPTQAEVLAQGPTGGAAAVNADAAPVDGDTAGASITKVAETSAATADQVKDIQGLIDRGDYQAAIDKAIEAYGVDTRGKRPTFDRSLPGNIDGITDPNRNNEIRIGPTAFSSPGALASTIFHESVHVRQNEARGSGPDSPEARRKDEIEAYRAELDNAARFGLTEQEKEKITNGLGYWSFAGPDRA